MRPRILALVSSVSLLALSLAVRPADAQLCNPSSCPDAFHGLTFEGLATGASIEGVGTVDPLLIVTSLPWSLGPSCPAGSAAVIEEGNPVPYPSYAAGAGPLPNDCLSGTRGFGDDAGCVLDYQFTFVPGVSVSCFSIRILDYGDFFPYGGATHQVLLTAYDATNAIVDQDAINMLGGVDLGGGDACVTQAAVGNTRLSVSGSGIVKVLLTYDAFPDPNVGYDDITFCEEGTPTPTRARSLGRVKSIYR